MARIYHITSKQEARAAEKNGVYAPAAFELEGFIHCSMPSQVVRVAAVIRVMDFSPGADSTFELPSIDLTGF